MINQEGPNAGIQGNARPRFIAGGSFASSIKTRLMVFFLAALLSGCGRSVGKVQGKITIKNNPVTSAELLFQPEAAPEQQYFGIARPDGTYQVSYRTQRGIPVGRCTVTITRYVQAGGKALPEGEKGDAIKATGKAMKETYVFEKEIVSGENKLDFELEAGKKSVVRLNEEGGEGIQP